MVSIHPAEVSVRRGFRPWGIVLVSVLAAAGGSPCAAQPATARVAVAGDHALLLKTDGSVWAWGNGDEGELGNGSVASSTVPVQVLGLGSIIAIAAGSSHNLALRNDGTVWAWGGNYYGQIGQGTTSSIFNPVTVPIPVPGLANMTAIAVGVTHSLALRADGTVWAWGGSANGQVGNGSTTFVTSPTQITSVAGSTAIGGGDFHSLVVRGNGTVSAWGYNVSGQLGNGSVTNSAVPVQVPGLGGVVAVSGGFSFSLARKADGSVWAWGDNGAGQLGNGTVVNSLVAVPVQTPSGMIEVQAASFHGLARRSDGTLWTWGRSLVDNTNAIPPTTVPVPLPGLSNVVACASDQMLVLAITGDDRVWASGTNTFGGFGEGTPDLSVVPVLNQRLPTALSSVVSGSGHGLAIANGVAWAWGDPVRGQTGQSAMPGSLPAPLPGLGAVTRVAAGGGHSLAVLSDSTVRAFGANSGGQLGNGTTVNSPTPVAVPGLTGVTAVAAGLDHSLAVRSNGSIWSFGRNNYGQLGNGTTSATPVTVPVQAQSLGGFIAVAAGGYHSLGLMANGGVSSAGRNNYGQLGYSGTQNFSTVFAQIGGLNGMTAIAAGFEHSLAVRNDGRLYAWGYNNNGQLGNGTLANGLQPIQVPGLTGVVGVAAGYRHSVALRNDGTVWCFGQNISGQLGDGTFTNRSSPVQVPGLGGIVAVAAGSGHSLAVGSDGSVWAWGSNAAGQSGAGGVTSLPVRVRIEADAAAPFWIDLARTAQGGATLSVTGIPAGAGSGLTLFSATTPAHPGQGALWGITADPLTFTMVLAAPTPAAGSPIHWLAGIPGVFPAAPFVLPPGSMIPLSGQVWDAVAVAVTPSGFQPSNVDRVAW